MEPAIRAPRPVRSTAAPITNPPKTNQNAPEVKPENTTEDGAIDRVMANRKNTRTTNCSGRPPVASMPMVTSTKAPATAISGGIVAGGMINNMAAARVIRIITIRRGSISRATPVANRGLGGLDWVLIVYASSDGSNSSRSAPSSTRSPAW